MSAMEKVLRAQTELRTLQKYSVAGFDNGLALIPGPDSACFQRYALCKEPTHGGVALSTQLLRVHLLLLIPVSSEALKNSFVSLLTVHRGVPHAPHAWLFPDINSRWPRLWYCCSPCSVPHCGCDRPSTLPHTLGVMDLPLYLCHECDRSSTLPYTVGVTDPPLCPIPWV